MSHDNKFRRFFRFDHRTPRSGPANMTGIPSHTPAPGQTFQPARQFRGGVWRSFKDIVTEERTVTVKWEDPSSGTAGKTALRAWPHDLPALAAGHVLLEKTDRAAPKRAIVTQTGDRAFLVSLEPAPCAPTAASQFRPLHPEIPLRAMRAFITAPSRWDATGCFHQAGVFDPWTNALVVRTEDIGRHNCLDRLAGWANANGTDFADKVLLVSARLTGSLAAKALRAGFPVLVSRSAVTTEAVDMVREAGAALIGFARAEEDRFTLFADPSGRVGAGG